MNDQDVPRPAGGRLWRSVLGVSVGFVVATGAIAAPWFGIGRGTSTTADGYFPYRDGSAVVLHGTESDDVWRSTSFEELTALQALNREPPALSRVISETAGTTSEMSLAELDDQLRPFRVLRQTTIEAAADGSRTTTVAIVMNGPDGVRFAGFEDSAIGTIAFSPAITMLPADIADGDRWEEQGTAAGVPFQWTSRARARESVEVSPGRFEECIEVESGLAYGTAPAERSSATYCAGVGTVVEDGVNGRFELESTDRIPPQPGSDLAAPKVGDSPSAGPPDRWQLVRVTRALAEDQSVRPTSVVPIPGDPTAMLVGTESHDGVVALAAGGDAPGSEVWSFTTGAPVFGTPAADAAAGRIYFGSSAKRVDAVALDGRHLWTHRTQDNVAASPAVAADGEIVVVAGEDHRVRGLDAATGEQQWAAEVDEAVAVTPAVVGDVVVIGDDGGGISAFDARTGARVVGHLRQSGGRRRRRG